MSGRSVWLGGGLCALLLVAARPGYGQQSEEALAAWRGRISAQLASQKRFPQEARGQSGTAKVFFRIDRSGNVISDKIVESTGVPALDAAAIEMIRRAQPFPSPPAGLADESFEFTVPVIFTMQPPMSVTDAPKDAAIEKGESAVNARINGVCRGC